ncbi:MAG TPA: CAP domain-containing protein [Glycomyces sp.]|nr:CAP domain-containing protein [Glycomyces sp.]
MRRLQGGRHRDPAETRRRMLGMILATFGLAAAATSLWALNSPLDGFAASNDAAAPTTVTATSEQAATSPETVSELAPDEAGIRTQEPEAVPTTETPEETTEEAAPTENGDAGSSDGDGDGDEDQPESSEYADTEAAVEDLVNRARGDAGCGDLARDANLDDAARLHAEDMAANDYFSHTSQDGRSPSDRAADQGYQGGVGENIAAGYPDAESVMDGWMNSEGHRANILNCGYAVIGIGIADRDGTLYWVQNFG